MIWEKIKKIDTTLVEIWVGIVFFGVLCQLTVVWFLHDKVGYSLGLWLGILLALLSALHMWWSITRYLDHGTDAPRVATKDNLIRYAVITVAMVLVMVTGVAQPLAFFLGLMGLKVAAYLRPITHKLLRR
ncbi:MAG: ATP synthase subunit I [Lachnospiraceae bacterium]|jgi:uncharacterized membrane protein|nr:ATP synthase subunit I [Lachnospiraceae bacterium]